MERTRLFDPQLDQLTPADVIVTTDPIRSTRHPAYLITIVDTASRPDRSYTTYDLIPEPGIDGSYLLPRPCPDCRQDVPTYVVASLVDLGRALNDDPTLLTPNAPWDRGHPVTCRRYRSTQP